MRYILIFMLFTSALFGQQQSETIRGSMITITNVPPTFVPGPGAPWFAKVITTGDFYEWDWNENTWHNTGARLYETGTSGVPTYVPGVSRKEFAINLEGELYYWTGSWNLITPDLSGYVQYSDSLATFVTPTQLSDSLGGHLTWSDTATIATQYYVNSQGFLTVELDGDSTNELQTISRSNDTIFLSDGGFAVLPPSTDTSGFNQSLIFSGDTLYLTDGNGTLFAVIPPVDLTPYVQYSDSLTVFITPTQLSDSLAAIPAAIDTATYLFQDSILIYYANGIEFGRDTIRFDLVDLSDYVQYSDSLTTFVTPSQLVDSINAIPAVDLSGYVEFSDSLTVFVTPSQLIDSLAAIPSGPQGPPGTPDSGWSVFNEADVTISSNSETAIVTQAIPAATVINNGTSIDFSVQGVFFNSTGANRTFTPRYKLNGVTIYNDVSGNLATLATGRDVAIQGKIIRVDSVTARIISQLFVSSGAATTTGNYDFGATSVRVGAPMSVVATVNWDTIVDFEISMQLSATVANLTYTHNWYAMQSSAGQIGPQGPPGDTQDLTIGGSGPTYTIDISGGDDVTISAAGIATLSEPTANTLLITATEVDGSVTNELQTISTSGAAGNITLSDGGGTLNLNVDDADASATNEIQQIDTFAIVSNILRASLSSDGVPFKSVDLSPYLDNTDSQEVGKTGSNDVNLQISGAAGAGTVNTITNVLVPSNGTDGQVLTKGTGTNYGWQTATVNTDSTTILSQDSILIYYALGVEYDRDTIRIPSSGGISGGVANYLTRWSGATSLDTTGLYWTGGRLGLGTITPGAKFETIGQGSTNATSTFSLKNSLGNFLMLMRDGYDLYVNGDHTSGIRIGYGAYNQNTNLAVGRLSLNSNISGTENLAIGTSALSALTTGERNTAIGATALINSNSSENVAIGWWASTDVTTSFNTAIGTRSLQSNNSGSGANVAIGFQAGRYVTERLNTAIGAYSMSAVATTNVQKNVAIGGYTMSTIPTGSDENTSVGYASMGLVGGDYNTNVGAFGGTLNTAGGNFTSASKYTAVGYYTRGTQGSTNETVLGAEAFGKGSNTATIGNSSVTVLYLAGAVGWFQGAGSPEGVVTAPRGSFYSNTSGGTGTTFWVKELGFGNTGWVAK
jgi:hypothetical protein